MKIGILFDLHNTLTNANTAWKLAYKSFVTPDEYDDISVRIDQKESREKLAGEYGLNYQLVIKKYRENLSINPYGLFLLDSFLPYFDVFLITNSNKNKALKDLKKLNLEHKFKKIYTKADGIKPDPKYIESILLENKLDMAYFIGNDSEEDFICSPKVISLIINFKNLNHTLK